MTPKQQRFVQEYLKDLNATQAAIRAGYSAHTANEQGSRLLTKASVREAVAKAQDQRAEKLEITAEKVLRDLEASRIAATNDGQHSAAIKASELQGKHVGMFVERRETTVKRLVAPAEKIPEPSVWLEKHSPRPH